jgi:hypothetical protein
MNEFTIVTTIGRPVAGVFAVTRDVARTSGMDPRDGRGPPDQRRPAGARSHARLPRDVPRAKVRDARVCTALAESKQFAIQSTAAPLYIEIDTTSEPVAEGIQVTSFTREKAAASSRWPTRSWSG